MPYFCEYLPRNPTLVHYARQQRVVDQVGADADLEVQGAGGTRRPKAATMEVPSTNAAAPMVNFSLFFRVEGCRGTARRE